MPNKKPLSYVALSLLACGLIGVCLYLVDKDMATGSSYPVYSSLRADPDGCKVLHEALGRVSGLTVSRNYRSTPLLKESSTTLLMLGITEYALLHESSAGFAEWERLAKTNRLVLSVDPANAVMDLTEARKKSVLASRWGVELGRPTGRQPEWRRVFNRADSWTELFAYRGKPVLLERRFGHGSVVLAADSSFLANETLAKKPDVILLARIAGLNRRVVFDESHFGITETGGVMALAHRYRLQGLLFGLAILAVLFFWQAGAVFPVRAVDPVAQSATGRDAQQGFAGLLRRHVPQSQLIEECLRQWRKTAPRDTRFARMRAAANMDRDPLLAYVRIQKELASKERRP